MLVATVGPVTTPTTVPADPFHTGARSAFFGWHLFAFYLANETQILFLNRFHDFPHHMLNFRSALRRFI